MGNRWPAVTSFYILLTAMRNSEKRTRKRLIPCLGPVSGPNDLIDCYQIIAANIEGSLIQAGATPGKDYTVLDVYKLAQPFVLERFRKGEVKYQESWPDSSS